MWYRQVYVREINCSQQTEKKIDKFTVHNDTRLARCFADRLYDQKAETFLHTKLSRAVMRSLGRSQLINFILSEECALLAGTIRIPLINIMTQCSGTLLLYHMI